MTKQEILKLIIEQMYNGAYKSDPEISALWQKNIFAIRNEDGSILMPDLDMGNRNYIGTIIRLRNKGHLVANFDFDTNSFTLPTEEEKLASEIIGGVDMQDVQIGIVSEEDFLRNYCNCRVYVKVNGEMQERYKPTMSVAGYVNDLNTKGRDFVYDQRHEKVYLSGEFYDRHMTYQDNFSQR